MINILYGYVYFIFLALIKYTKYPLLKKIYFIFIMFLNTYVKNYIHTSIMYSKGNIFNFYNINYLGRIKFFFYRWGRTNYIPLFIEFQYVNEYTL